MLRQMRWAEGPPGELVFSPRPMEKKIPLEWYEMSIASFTKSKPPKIQIRKQGLFDDIRKRPSHEVRAPPSSPIQFDRQNANHDFLQRSEFQNADPRRWSITSNAGSDDTDREEDFQVAYLLFSEQ